MQRKQINLIISIYVLFSVYFLSGKAYASLDDVESAIIRQDFQQAKSVATQMLLSEIDARQRDELRYYLGLCELRLENYDQARVIFTELIKSSATFPLRDKSYLGLFDVYYMRGDYKEAKQQINRLLKVSPRSEFLSIIYLKAARANLKLARWKEAHRYLTKIVTDYPDSLETHVAKQLLNEKQYFAVQVGAFIDRNRAEKLAQELQQKGEYAYIVETIDRENRKFYRVRVGQLVLLNEAQKLKSKLSEEGYPARIYP